MIETNIHYPTDSSLLGDGTRVLTRTMKKIEVKSVGLKRKVRDRMRSIRKRVVAIALATRLMGEKGEERRKRQYQELLSLTKGSCPAAIFLAFADLSSWAGAVSYRTGVESY